MRRFLRLSVTLLVPALLTAACQSKGGGHHGSKSGLDKDAGPQVGIASTAERVPGCRNPGPRTAALLPKFDSSPLQVDSDLNPCLPSTKLVGTVLDKLSGAEKERAGSEFLGKVGVFTKRLDTLADVQECAYQTDRLALGVYHHRDYAWSIGVVAVVRGGLGAVADTAQCYLLKMIESLNPVSQTFDQAPSPSPCFTTIRAKHDGEAYTIMWIGSSDVMCGTFTTTYVPMVPGAGPFTTVTADPTVAVRKGPGTGTGLVTRVPFGTIGRAVCSAHGTPVNSDDVWIRAVVNDSTGYIARAYLDHGEGDVPPPCE
ncbi:MAG: hypothetical protein ACJ786_05545 [Catenulispora sp.]